MWRRGVLAGFSAGLLALTCGSAFAQNIQVSPLNPITFNVGVEGGIGHSVDQFKVTSPFNVTGNGGVIGVNGGFLFNTQISPFPGSVILVGPQFGALFGNTGGTISNVAGFDYTTKTDESFWAEIEVKLREKRDIRHAAAGLAVGWVYDSSVSAGVVRRYESIIGTSGAFTVTDSAATTGFTASLGVGFPITDNLEMFGRARGFWYPSTVFNIPGPAPIVTNIYVATVGFEYTFGDGTPFVPK